MWCQIVCRDDYTQDDVKGSLEKKVLGVAEKRIVSTRREKVGEDEKQLLLHHRQLL